MKPHFWSLARSSLVAMSLVAGMATPSLAAPLMPMNQFSSLTTPGIGAETVQWHRGHGGGNWRGGRWHGNNWRGGNWHGRHWRGNNWRRYGRHYGGSSFYFGLGLPFYGLYGPGYGLYGPGYGWYGPRYYAPRRYYRARGLSQGHIDWCYSRYRSYRAYDNTFQPYNGPRRQCYSPYG
ncbi:BA14K family protein [Pseudaminobacter arsenicus]|uniref:Lectin-like protein BA14k n=1 Tax=Borborobacter arsenicus TaxID=1851146 RepID=A0A432VC37_9HYPH|nr:BA14K family protein [Pseudaminobacter arsenicus]RUM99727.1 BA14K family protein [Pseudaminobacter arsenicus]